MASHKIHGKKIEKRKCKDINCQLHIVCTCIARIKILTITLLL